MIKLTRSEAVLPKVAATTPVKIKEPAAVTTRFVLSNMLFFEKKRQSVPTEPESPDKQLLRSYGSA